MNLYPSGIWNGYWEQPGYGRQPMRDFLLRFANGEVAGEGIDIVGAFTVSGEYDDRGAVRLTKKYVGRHTVLYEGKHDGEGTIFGQWSIAPIWSGTFAMRPVRSLADPNLPIQTIE